MKEKTQRIDVHHHLSPPTHIEALRKLNLGNPRTDTWTPQQSLDEMDKAGVTTALLAVTTPGVTFLTRDDARRIARECNEYGARLKTDFPGRFGLFATVPMSCAEDGTDEIEYAYDTLGTDGICLMTSYGDKWLGHRDFAPVLEVLHRRRAVVHVHPTAPDCCADVLPDIAPSLIEYGTDTTRALASLIFTGTSARYKEISFIFSHGGGTMPYLIERFNNLPNSDKRYASFTSEGVVSELRRFFYDTAIITHPAPLSALTNLIPLSQILFGSDFPLRSAAMSVEGLAAFFDGGGMEAIDSENILRLLPKLKAI
jgi:predicted TIM-barrel fold metal-dependent hydrolase